MDGIVSSWSSEDYDKKNIELCVKEIKEEFGQQFSNSKSILEQHTHTMTIHESELPDGVVFVESKADVQKVVKICKKYKCPIIPFGIGSSFEGHLNAPYGGISIDMNNMNKILKVYQDDLLVVVQPGVTREQLNTYLRDTGLFFPIDPGANASIGGMAATRASGTNAVRYGTMKDNVIALEVVMPDGQIIKTANKARKSSAGYDLTRLMVDDDGDFSNGGTTLISPSSIDGQNVTFDVDFTDGQYYTLGSIETGALPITLISFEAKANEANEVTLDWVTATEVNNSFYTIERSVDGTNFETVANIDGAGNSDDLLFYSYIDTKPINGLSFYRLKQTDFNGEFDYSEVRSVRIERQFKATFKAYPNPIAKGETLRIRYELDRDQTLKMIFLNATGRIIRTEERTVAVTEEFIEVNTQDFGSGLNLIRIIDENGHAVTLKVIVS